MLASLRSFSLCPADSISNPAPCHWPGRSNRRQYTWLGLSLKWETRWSSCLGPNPDYLGHDQQTKFSFCLSLLSHTQMSRWTYIYFLKKEGGEYFSIFLSVCLCLSSKYFIFLISYFLNNLYNYILRSTELEVTASYSNHAWELCCRQFSCPLIN